MADSPDNRAIGTTNNDTDLFFPPRWLRAWRWGAPALALAILAWIAGNCLFNPKIHFLTPGPGKWITYSLPSQAYINSEFELVGTFRRAFILREKPAAARLSWRCLTNGEVIVNGMAVPFSGPPSENWKSVSRMDIAPFLQKGSNEISVVVTNKLGPPAMSLALESGNVSLVSDERWEVSVSGSDWRPAWIVSGTPRPGKGNSFALLETPMGALARCWPWLALFAVVSVGLALLLRFHLRQAASPKIILLILAAAWALLFLHNIPWVPPAAGFDCKQHLDYVHYLQAYRTLPPPGTGFEMFQPPLYYILAAATLTLAGCDAWQLSGMMLLHYVNLLIGAATMVFLFIGLRYVFPDDWKKPLAGTVLGAFLPAQLYLLHYTTNETLAAMLVTAALCFCLRILRTERPGWGWYLALTIALELAVLSKVSAIVIVPVIAAAVALKFRFRREPTSWARLGAIGGLPLICLCLTAWPYLTRWREYGDPLAGNITAVGAWWQYKGLETPDYYLSFGNVLTHPFLSGFHSFWDAFHTTLWGDGLMGGVTDFWERPPWNYDFVAIGFVLALAPEILVLTGFVRALARCFSAGNLIWMLLLVSGSLYALAILNMSVRVPSYSQTKAFFGLPALLPFCAFGALGFEFWAGRSKAVGSVWAVVLGVWLLNVYASFWIQPDSLQRGLATGISRFWYVPGDSSEAFREVLQRYPDDPQANAWLGAAESKKDPKLAVPLLEQASKTLPPSAPIESELAVALGLCNRMDEGLLHARRAVELAPDEEYAANTWCSIELRRQDFEGCVKAGRYALTLDPADSKTHFEMGVALMNLRRIAEATTHFQAVVDGRPSWAGAQYYLGRCLLELPGRQPEARAHLQEAVRLDPSNSAWRAFLQTVLKGG